MWSLNSTNGMQYNTKNDVDAIPQHAKICSQFDFILHYRNESRNMIRRGNIFAYYPLPPTILYIVGSYDSTLRTEGVLLETGTAYPSSSFLDLCVVFIVCPRSVSCVHYCDIVQYICDL